MKFYTRLYVPQCMPLLKKLKKKENSACQRESPFWKEAIRFPTCTCQNWKNSVLKLLCSLVFQADHNIDVNAEEDDDGELALWSPEIKIVELVKDHKGLGFSILDYQV